MNHTKAIIVSGIMVLIVMGLGALLQGCAHDGPTHTVWVKRQCMPSVMGRPESCVEAHYQEVH